MRLTKWLGSAAGLLCLGFLIGSAAPALATPMPLLPVQSAGDTLFTPAFNYAQHGVNAGNFATLASVSDLGGTLITSLNSGSGNAFTSASSTFSGTLFETVVQNDASNPYYNGGISSVTGALTFIFDLTNNGTSVGSISRLSLNSWAGFPLDATLAGSGVAGFEATRSSSTTDGGAVVGETFTNYTPSGGNPYPGTTQLNPGQTSMEFILNTNATSYTTSFASVIGGADTASNVGIFVPVPEPGSIALLLSGLGSLALIGWRRFAARRDA